MKYITYHSHIYIIGNANYILFSGGGRAQMEAWKVHIAESPTLNNDDASTALEHMW